MRVADDTARRPDGGPARGAAVIDRADFDRADFDRADFDRADTDPLGVPAHPPIPPLPAQPADRAPGWLAGDGRMLPAATFGQRLGARLIDGVLLGVLAVGVALAASALLRGGIADAGTGALVVLCVAVVLLPLTYRVAAEGAAAAATPGQALLDLRVVRLADGGQPGAARALGRALASLVGNAPLGLGSLAMLWDPDRRAWQDRASGTRVVQTPQSRVRAAFVAGLVSALLVCGLALAGVSLLDHGGNGMAGVSAAGGAAAGDLARGAPGPGSGPGGGGGTPAPLVFSSATASSTAPDAPDAAGNTVSYGAANLIDDNPATAWRAAGNGSGITLRLSFGRRVRLSAIGLIPGYAKTDPTDGADRFPQNRRVTEVSYRFDDGTQMRATFADSRKVQTTPVDVTTADVTIMIVGTTAPGDRDYTAISDVRAWGTG